MIPAPIPGNEAERIATLRNYRVLDTEPERSFDAITNYVAKQFNAEIALVSLVDTDRQWFKASCGLDAKQTPRDLAFCAYTILENKVHYVPDATQDPRFKGNPLVTGDPNIRFYCGAPLIAPNGQSIGSLCVIDSKTRHDFTETDQDLLQDMAAMVVEQLEIRKAAGDVADEIETRVIAEANAKEAASDLRAFVDSVPVAIALIDKNGTYHARSERWRELQEDLFEQGSEPGVVKSIHNRPKWEAAFVSALSGTAVSETEDQLKLRDGRIEYTNWEMRPWFNDDRLVKGVVISASMVTEQVEARLETERQNELFNAVLENVEDGVVACDPEGRLTLFNSKTRTMHGLDVIDLPIEECGEFYSLFHGDGVTPLEGDHIPLFKALAGERVVNQAMVIAPQDLPKRDIIAQATPLKRPDGSLIGAVASMADVTAEKQARRDLENSEARAVHIAFHDTLTGLANRAKFNEMKSERDLIDGKSPQAAFFIDLNRFKRVNDTMGHKVGDDLLIAVAEDLKTVVGEEAFVARFGGDEFIAIMPVRDCGHAEEIGQEIIDRLNTPKIIDGNTVVAGAAVGFALAPDHGDCAETLVRRADIAMYRGKSEGIDEPVLFEPVFELNTIERARLEDELLRSIELDELRVVFQPIVCGENDVLRGVEALVRWEHPRLGWVGPDKFIPIAEECGFIVALGEWVLNAALRQIAAYDDLFLSVNVSPVQFRDPEFASKVLSGLRSTGVDPNRLELEVTESLLINDTKVAGRVIKSLKRHGIRIALDDFGTGYSSLSYIHQFPFDKVKIDRSFVSQLGASGHSEAVIRCVVDLASSLGMIVTAEGVECDDHETALKQIGCHTLQGYKYGKPGALNEIGRTFGVNSKAA